MFISVGVYEALLDAGVRIVDRGTGAVDFYLASDGTAAPQPFQVKTWNRSIGPAELRRVRERELNSGSRLLLIAPTISAVAAQEIEHRGWSWIVSPEMGPVRGELITASGAIRIGSSSADVSAGARVPRRGRRPVRRYAILRHLLLRESWTQKQLVDVCRVSQPRVSQVLNELLERGSVESQRLPGRALQWRLSDYGNSFDDWLGTYPGPGGAAPTYWFGLDTIALQVGSAMNYLTKISSSGAPVASGDAAADLVAPYRSSRLGVVYSPVGADLSHAGLTPAPREAATLKLVVPQDDSVWPHSADDPTPVLAPNAPFPLADPLQIAWDLLDGGTIDGAQAVLEVKKVLGRARSPRSTGACR